MYNKSKPLNPNFKLYVNQVASKIGIPEAIVEKDFWICLTLDYLFNHSKWKGHLAFKGGTCLSKVHHLIKRFSEDIDLILDWRLLGYNNNEPWIERSNTQQQKFIDESKERLFLYLKSEFLEIFKKDMSQMYSIECEAYIDSDNQGTVVFAYPHEFEDASILNTIRLEIGTLSSWKPLQKATIKSFLSEEYPTIFSQPPVALLATTPERAFFEKLTILHHEAHRPEYSKFPTRYSRHYYDVYCMCKNGVKNSALKNPNLLEEVALFKKRFYPRGWAKYEEAKVGTLQLMPNQYHLKSLIEDYRIMQPMIYGDRPSFEEILKTIQSLEKEINALVKS